MSLGKENSNSFEVLDNSRTEMRWKIPAENLQETQNALSAYERIHYDNPWARTIYFGVVSKDDNGIETILPTGDAKVSLKAREFINEPSEGRIFLLDPKTKFRFEAKIMPSWDSNSPKRKKYTVKKTTLESLTKALYSGDYSKLDPENNFPRGLLPAVLKKSGYDRFGPIGIVQYHRDHFKSTDPQNGNVQRITLDSDITVWDIDWTGHNYAASKVMMFPHGILEIKNQGGTSQYPNELQELVKPLESLKPKHDILFERVDNKLGMTFELYYEPDQEGWIVNEQERKIDLDRDPKPFLRGLNLGSDFIVSAPFDKTTLQRFYRLPDKTQSACIMEEIPNVRGQLIKAKILNQGSLTYQSRKEIVKSLTDENKQIVSQFLGVDLDRIPFAPSFERRRVTVNILDQKTGRVFEAAADECVAEDNRPNLNQIEVEYLGTLTGHVIHPTEGITKTEVDQDLTNLKMLLQQSLLDNGYGIIETQTTKSEWICAEK